MKQILILLIGFFVPCSISFAQMEQRPVKAKVILDNDFGSDPDGLFSLAHFALCPTVDIRGIIVEPSQYRGTDPMESSFYSASAVVKALEMEERLRLYRGAEHPMTSMNEPVTSEGAELIVNEARKANAANPLFVCAGGTLTNVASALLMDPTIADKMIVVWIGGVSYNSLDKPHHGAAREANLTTDLLSAQYVFNKSHVRLWQVPVSAYTLCLYSLDEMAQKVNPCGTVGELLYDAIMSWVNYYEELGKKNEEPISYGEDYNLGDSPLVWIVGLDHGSLFVGAPSKYASERKCPMIDDDGWYVENAQGRTIRVYHDIDLRLMFGDMEAKLKKWASNQSKIH
jgi:purine nucleosidase